MSINSIASAIRERVDGVNDKLLGIQKPAAPSSKGGSDAVRAAIPVQDVVDISDDAAAASKKAQAARSVPPAAEKADDHSSVQRFYNAADTDGDGKVNKREFMTFFQNRIPEGLDEKHCDKLCNILAQLFDRASGGSDELSMRDFAGTLEPHLKRMSDYVKNYQSATGDVRGSATGDKSVEQIKQFFADVSNDFSGSADV